MYNPNPTDSPMHAWYSPCIVLPLHAWYSPQTPSLRCPPTHPTHPTHQPTIPPSHHPTIRRPVTPPAPTAPTAPTDQRANRFSTRHAHRHDKHQGGFALDCVGRLDGHYTTTKQQGHFSGHDDKATPNAPGPGTATEHVILRPFLTYYAAPYHPTRRHVTYCTLLGAHAYCLLHADWCLLHADWCLSSDVMAFTAAGPAPGPGPAPPAGPPNVYVATVSDALPEGACLDPPQLHQRHSPSPRPHTAPPRPSRPAPGSRSSARRPAPGPAPRARLPAQRPAPGSLLPPLTARHGFWGAGYGRPFSSNNNIDGIMPPSTQTHPDSPGLTRKKTPGNTHPDAPI